MMENNLFFRSLKHEDVHTYINHLKNNKVRFASVPSIDQNTFNVRYQETYGEPSYALWLGRKCSHLTLIFWDGIIKNVVNVFLLIVKTIFVLIFKAYHTRCFTKSLQDTFTACFIAEKINFLIMNLFNIAQNLILAFGHAYSLVNDKGGRFYIDWASLEKHGYSYRYLHEDAITPIFNNQVMINFNNKMLEKPIQKMFFEYHLSLNNFEQENNIVLAKTLNKLTKLYIEDKISCLLDYILKGITRKSSIEELQKKFNIINDLCSHLDANLARSLKYSFIFLLCRSSRYKLCENKLINLIAKNVNFCSSYFGLGNVPYIKNLDEPSLDRLSYNNKKIFLNDLVKANPKCFKHYLKSLAQTLKVSMHFMITYYFYHTVPKMIEGQQYVRELVQENKLFYFYADYIFNTSNYVPAKVNLETKEYEFLHHLIKELCQQKKEDVRIFLTGRVKFYEENPVEIGNFSAHSLVSELVLACNFWETLIDDRNFVIDFLKNSPLSYLESAVKLSKKTNKTMLTILCCFKTVEKSINKKMPKPIKYGIISSNLISRFFDKYL